MVTIMRNLADYLNMIRTDRGMSITEFSEELGISRSCMQLLLSGKANPRVDTLEHLVTRLGLNASDLMVSDGDLDVGEISPNPEQWKRICGHLKQIRRILGETNDGNCI